MVEGGGFVVMDETRGLIESGCTVGCDPEIFFTKGGAVIGAEKVIPKEGIAGASYSEPGAVVIDGVQAELHPPPRGCRQEHAGLLRSALLAAHAAAEKAGAQISFASHVEVTREELDQLSPECKVLGCSPSLNIYGFQDLGVDATTYRLRSAGGHIHLGLSHINETVMKERERLVPVLDVLLGNFCVLVDRDPYAAERRKVYGRAGEYRLPAHGLEYRTLSNFWLRSYPLFSMVMGIAKQAASVWYTSVMRRHYESQKNDNYGYFWEMDATLLKYVDLQQVRQAINQNDAALAKKNWEGVKRFLREEVSPKAHYQFYVGIDPRHLDQIDYFLRRIEEKGLESWFPQDPLAHWQNIRDTGSAYGWERFISSTVFGQMQKANAEGPSIAA